MSRRLSLDSALGATGSNIQWRFYESFLMKKHSHEFKNIIFNLLSKLDRLDDFNNAEQFYFQIKKDGFQPLVILKQCGRIIVAHYRMLDGQSVPDPEIEFWVKDDGEWYPASARTWNGGYYQGRFIQDGKEFLNASIIDELLYFVKKWTKIIKADHDLTIKQEI